MDEDQSIGGFFSLELNDLGSLFHDDSFALNTGRNSLEFILLNSRYKKVFIPYYTCDAILEPLIRLKIDYSFYSLDDNLLPDLTKIGKDDALLYINYFGLMSSNLLKLIKMFNNLIVDNSQAFFDKPIGNEPTFYSPRKFFGVPDGGFVYCSSKSDMSKFLFDKSSNRFSHLLNSIESNKEDSYVVFQNNELSLSNQPIMKMSMITNQILRSINYDRIVSIRRENFLNMHSKLKDRNLLTNLIDNSNFICPHVYPFYSKNNSLLREKLIRNKIFIPKYWSNVLAWVGEESLEYDLVENILPIPIDQRYNKSDLDRIINLI
jgi:hypothetical protein